MNYVSLAEAKPAYKFDCECDNLQPSAYYRISLVTDTAARSDAWTYTLVTRLRSVLTVQDKCSILSDNEYFIIQKHAGNIDRADAFAETLIHLLESAMHASGVVSGSVSIGYCLGCRHQAFQLAAEAERSMNLARQHPSSVRLSLSTGESEAPVPRAIGEISVPGYTSYYQFQPVVGIDEAIIGAETLLRFSSGSGADLSTAAVLAALEEKTLSSFGRLALFKAAAVACDLPNDMWLAVNVSAEQLNRSTLVSDVNAALEATGCSPDRLLLELTETESLEIFDEARRQLSELRAAGVKTAIDDFGALYTSSLYLDYLPFDVVKLDKRFIAQEVAANHHLPLEQIIAHIRAYGIEMVVVEGIDTEEKSRAAIASGADAMQGHYYSQPLRAEMLKAHFGTNSNRRLSL